MSELASYIDPFAVSAPFTQVRRAVLVRRMDSASGVVQRQGYPAAMPIQRADDALTVVLTPLGTVAESIIGDESQRVSENRHREKRYRPGFEQGL